jgi:thiol-disulfide isomerase/thioredoxin
VGDLTGTQWLVLALAAALAATVVVGGYAFVHLMQAYGRVLERLDRLETRLAAAGFDLDEPEDVPEIGIEPGTDIPDLELADLDGRRIALRGLVAAEVPTLLLFTSPTCGPCATLMPEVARWQHEHGDELAIVLVSSGDADAVRADAREYGLDRVFLDAEHAALDAFEANGTPSAVVVGPDGAIASWVAQGSDWIERLVELTLHGTDDEGLGEGLQIGEPAPALELPDLDGAPVSLEGLRGADTVLLFWNPGCGFCRSMHGDLLDWERRRNGGSPALVVVSSGSAADTAAEGFASTVLLDADFSAGEVFGAGGTPMAVRLDAHGKVASGLAAGGEAVLGLLGARDGAPKARSSVG